jgi:hypothetical protein
MTKALVTIPPSAAAASLVRVVSCSLRLHCLPNRGSTAGWVRLTRLGSFGSRRQDHRQIDAPEPPDRRGRRGAQAPAAGSGETQGVSLPSFRCPGPTLLRSRRPCDSAGQVQAPAVVAARRRRPAGQRRKLSYRAPVAGRRLQVSLLPSLTKRPFAPRLR